MVLNAYKTYIKGMYLLYLYTNVYKIQVFLYFLAEPLLFLLGSAPHEKML